MLSISRNAEKGYLWLEEWIADPEYEGAVLSTACHLAKASSLKEVRGWKLPLYSKLGTATLSAREKAIPMIAALDPAVAFTPGDLERAYFAGPDHF